MTARIIVWSKSDRIYADRQEIQVFLTGTAPVPEGYRTGWSTKYIAGLTFPVSYYLRGEEYSARKEAFGDAVLADKGAVENSFASAPLTDALIEMIHDSAVAGGGSGSFGVIKAAPRKVGLVGRILGR